MPKTLLVADDSLTIRKVIGMVLALEDFHLTSVDNGIDAIARAREMRPDLVLADVLMPGRSGYEVCEALKSDPSTAHVPVLLLSGNFEPFDEGRARAARADGHLTKPFESQALLDKVRALLGLPAGQPMLPPRPAMASQPAPASSVPRPSHPMAAQPPPRPSPTPRCPPGAGRPPPGGRPPAEPRPGRHPASRPHADDVEAHPPARGPGAKAQWPDSERGNPPCTPAAGHPRRRDPSGHSPRHVAHHPVGLCPARCADDTGGLPPRPRSGPPAAGAAPSPPRGGAPRPRARPARARSPPPPPRPAP